MLKSGLPKVFVLLVIVLPRPQKNGEKLAAHLGGPPRTQAAIKNALVVSLTELHPVGLRQFQHSFGVSNEGNNLPDVIGFK